MSRGTCLMLSGSSSLAKYLFTLACYYLAFIVSLRNKTERLYVLRMEELSPLLKKAVMKRVHICAAETHLL